MREIFKKDIFLSKDGCSFVIPVIAECFQKLKRKNSKLDHANVTVYQNSTIVEIPITEEKLAENLWISCGDLKAFCASCKEKVF